MKVSIQLFAGLAEAIGSGTLELDWGAERNLGEMRNFLMEKYPDAAPLIRQSFFSVNHEYADDKELIEEGDELALIPPVSGGEEDYFLITEEPVSIEQVISKVVHPDAGAVNSFIGTVRELTKGKKTLYLEYEAYVPMALRKMKQIGDEIKKKWPDAKVAITHRIGHLEISDVAVVIAVSTPHRHDSFEACRYAIERIKEMVPIWKKEFWEDGESWVGNQQGTISY
ncbi:molybdenum cofactor biosynthesis protein [Microaerobacter geothermalis]|uniref:molybdenum cofactor biosynthesis protein n=1 Tax=Microaerobacter geothermalis TaxID=674972 RepID=UPI002E32B174|nr:molybdenum cofactor biosynthesis protein MoaE [Microaerobacter geothermalis]